MMTFHEWKDKKVKQEGFFRPRIWYYQAYGNYVREFKE